MILVYVTCANEAEAKRIGTAMVKKSLAGCINYFPIKSIYEWNGKIKYGNEYVLILKTLSKYYANVRDEIVKMHSYEIPCILKINTLANKEFGSWIKNSTK